MLIKGDFVDFIRPDLKYEHQATDISTSTKKYIMTFNVTDKYYTSGELQLSDLEIKMQNGQKDENGEAIIYNLNTLDAQGIIDLDLVATPYYTPQSVKVTNSTSGEVEEIEVENGKHYITIGGNRYNPSACLSYNPPTFPTTQKTPQNLYRF